VRRGGLYARLAELQFNLSAAAKLIKRERKLHEIAALIAGLLPGSGNRPMPIK